MFSIWRKNTLQPFWRNLFFPIGIDLAKTRNIFDYRNHGLCPWLIYLSPSALYLWKPDKMLCLADKLCDYVFYAVKKYPPIFLIEKHFLRSINSHSNLREAFGSLAVEKHSKKILFCLSKLVPTIILPSKLSKPKSHEYKSK